MTGRPSVLVVGGGPAGLTLSRLLALRRWPSILVDPRAVRRRRLEHVGPPVVDAFRSAGIGDLLEDKSFATPSLGICRRWGTDERWDRDPFLTHRGGRGYVVDREILDRELRRRATDAGVEQVRGRFIGVRQSSKLFAARIRTEKGIETLDAGVIIDATGRPAAVGRRLGARRILRGLEFAYPCDAEPLPPDRRGWLNVMGNDADWTYSMEGPRGLIETWRVVNRRSGLPGGVDASSSILRPPAGRGWAAVGDAAAAFSPIRSEGLSHAIGSAIAIAGALLAEGSLTQDVGDIYTGAIEQYAIWQDSGSPRSLLCQPCLSHEASFS